MVYTSQQKGNVAESAVALELERLAPAIKSVIRVANQSDPNHWDLEAILADRCTSFFVQVKHLSRANLVLDMSHLRDWLTARTVTVPIWWDDVNRKAYWVDLLRYMIRTGGTLTRSSAAFNQQLDLNELNADDRASKESFLAWVTNRCSVWPRMHIEPNIGLQLNPEFPVGLIDIVREPDILSFLPVNSKVIHTLEQYLGQIPGHATLVTSDILKAGQTSVISPTIAATELARKYRIPQGDHEVINRLATQLAAWANAVDDTRKNQSAKVLWAFDKVLSITSYKNEGDVILPSFTSEYTYPIGRLVNIVPPEFLLESLEKILTRDRNFQVLLHASYYLGLLNYPRSTKVWSRVRAIRQSFQNRGTTVGPMNPAVQRQLLYTEAQTGCEEAKDKFISALKNPGAAQFDAAFNYHYYGGNAATIKTRFERKLDQSFGHSQFVREIVSLIYQRLSTALRDEPSTLTRLIPSLWPT